MYLITEPLFVSIKPGKGKEDIDYALIKTNS